MERVTLLAGPTPVPGLNYSNGKCRLPYLPHFHPFPFQSSIVIFTILLVYFGGYIFNFDE